jgi:uncharacterized protein YjiS (DUF1127 family)
MSAAVSNIARPAVGKAPDKFAQLLSACWDAIVGYFVRRAAIAALRELDDRALRDIGLARTQIEAAVHGLVTPFDQERMS